MFDDATRYTYDCWSDKFTGKERDSETGLDYFGARYYGSTMGRFLSPDEFAGGPVDVFGGDPTPQGPLPYADITNPQSLNKYSYTYNNPLRYTDPDGHDIWDTLLGVVNSTANNFAGVQRIEGGNADFRAGQVIGDVASVVAGTVGAVGAAAGDAALDVGTGGAALLAAPAQAAAVAIPANGALQGAKNLISTFSNSSNSESRVDKVVDTIDKGGFEVKTNPKKPNQEGNVTITNPKEPGKSINVRVETHPLKPNAKPQRHVNVDSVTMKNGKKTIDKKHITE